MVYSDMSDELANIIANFDWSNPLHIAIGAVLVLIAIMFVWAAIVSIWLAVKYVKFNKLDNSMGKTGEEVARKILDDNDLQNIKVSKSGSFMFGNSYSHFFKKVRLRRRTWQKTSLTSMAMATQKSCLAIMDKEGDKAMKLRIALTPITFFGPIAFIPLIIVGVAIDILVFNTIGAVSVTCTIVGIVIFLASFIIQFCELKTEKKAQEKAYVICKEKGYATDEEIGMMKELFRLYNIEYINNIILSILEIVLRILLILAKSQGSSSSSSSTSD